MVMEDDFTLGGEHTMHYYRACSIEMYTWNLHDLINQCHLNKFNKIKTKRKILWESEIEMQVQEWKENGNKILIVKKCILMIFKNRQWI